ncbi:MAG: arylsulfatase, partial [Planctomycetales bacterium]|nr:arylsulfatase [Planctomycetales bacterium]
MMMLARRPYLILAAFHLAAACLAAPTLAPAAQPNIVLIMSDDMGYSDLGCYGGEIQTPTLNRLAEGGLRFTQFYNTGRCCPTRASLLTGLYPHQAGVGWMMTDRGHDGYRGELNRQSVTIAEALKPAGYATYAVGKWHVTKATNPDGPKDNWPLQRGFDRYYGTITGAGSFYDPGTLTRDNTMISPFADSEYQPKQYYYTDAISDHAVRFINEHGQDNLKRTEERNQPFFMYVAYTAAHWPMHALPEDIAKYEGKYSNGYKPIREARFERMKQLGLIEPTWQMSPQAGNWEQVEHPAWEARCMEVYAAMIDRMDQGISRIVSTLKERGQLDNTLIFFLQDNGGCQETNGRNGDRRRPVEPSLPAIAADAIRLDVVPKQNRAGVPTLTGPHIMPGPEDTYIAYGLNWANVSNTPFREYKHFVHEGGISTPLIAHWPAGIKRHGELERQPGHLIDIMATCVDVAGAKYPKTYHQDQKIKPLEGRSLKPAFTGQTIERDAIYWEHEGNRAIRVGNWKLVAKENQPWELYNLELDRPELHNLAAEQPDRVKELSAKWDAWAARANVLPLGGWRG